MIKLWQKTTLALIASGGLYGGLLHSVEAHQKQSNQAAAALRQQQQQQVVLAAELKQERETLVKLVNSLQQVKGHTAHIQQQIAAVKEQIHKLQLGVTVGAIRISSSGPVNPNVNVPNFSQNPPQVQTVTKASGA